MVIIMGCLKILNCKWLILFLTFSGKNENNPNNVNSNENNSKVPEKYFIVKNNDYVRIKYILVYAEKTKIKRWAFFQTLKNKTDFLRKVLFSLKEKQASTVHAR